MKTFLPISILSCSIGIVALAADGAGPASEDAEPPSSIRAVGPAAESSATTAHAILGNMLARMPREPLALSGRLILRRRGGFVVSETPFKMELDWGAEPPRAVYSLYDHFGRVVSVATVIRSAGGFPEMTLADAEGKKCPAPLLSASIAGTDVTWLDLSLSYLWWPDARLDGEEEFRGALCDRVIVTPPVPIPGCAAVRLWIDRKRGVLRQAEQLDAKGNRLRWMWVASVGKINDRWMIRNIEVKRPGTGMQTKLHVDDLEIP